VSKDLGIVRQEIDILFRTICDGLRIEANQRRLAYIAGEGQLSFSLREDRESQTVSCLAQYIRTTGFLTLVEPYFHDENPMIRPDLGIWLPVSREFLYLELKRIGQGWGKQRPLHDIIKLDKLSTDPKNKLNGLVVVGFGLRDGLLNSMQDISKEIVNSYPYLAVGVERFDLGYLDSKASANSGQREMYWWGGILYLPAPKNGLSNLYWSG